MHALVPRALASIAALTLASACVVDSDETLDADADAELEPQVCMGPCEPAPGGGVIAPPSDQPDPDKAYVTFYSGPNQTGSWWTVSGKTVAAMPHIQLFDSNTLTSWGLYQNVGSVRLQCGTRPAAVTLTSLANAAVPYEQWAGSGAFVACNPGQVATIDDVASITDLGGLSLQNRVRSATFYAHAPTHHPFTLDFDGQVLQSWINEVPANLPSGATVKSPATIKMVGWAGFELRQDLYLNHWSCAKRAGHFVLSGGPKIVGGQLAWSVTVKETYVNTGWGDSWGCRSGMKSKLQSGASSAAQMLTDELTAVPSAAIPTNGAAYYFAPRDAFTKFDLHVAL